jgi:surface carbohydrate biosynthesis protein
MFLKKRSYFEKYNKILYLPIEIHSREFHSKLYLAHQACKRGWAVVIGPEYDVNKITKYLPSGVYYGIGFHDKASKISKNMKKFGHSVVLQDEEGLVRWSPEFYKEYRVNPEINNFSDYFLCWGKEHKEIIQSAFKTSVNAIAIGNPRVDILSKSLRKIFSKNINDIKNNYGDFILINGNFGSANHTNGQDYLLNEFNLRGWLNTSYKKEFHLNRIKFQKKIFEKMIELSIALAKSGKKVIVRPHPSENIDVWKEQTKNHSKNIKIIRSGNILPWLMASKLVIHNGCTTAIEAVLLGKIVISYQPLKYPRVESYLPNAISISFENIEEILSFLNDLKENKLNIRKEVLDILDDYIKKDEYNENSTSRILDLIEYLPKKKIINTTELIKKNILIEVSLLKAAMNKLMNKKNFIYSKSKCPKLNAKEVKMILDLFQDENNREHNQKIINLTKYSVVISH